MFQDLRITPKFILVFLLVTTVPASVINFLHDKGTTEAVRESAYLGLRALSRSEVSDIRRFIKMHEREALGLAGTLAMRQLVSTGSNYQSTYESIRKSIYSVVSDKNISFKDRRISSVSAIDVYDYRGMLIASTRSEDISAKISGPQLEYIRENGIHHQDFSGKDSAEVKEMKIRVPIYSEADGRFAGVLSLAIDADEIESIVSNAVIGGEGRSYVVDKNKNFVAKPAFVDLPENLVNMDHIDKCFSEKTTLFYSRKKIEPAIGITRHIDEFDWCVASEISLQDVYAVTKRFRRRIDEVIFAFFILLFVLVLVISRSFAKLVIRIRDGAKEYSKGEFDVRMNITRKDEIGELASTFDEMADQLNESREENYRQSVELAEQVDKLKRQVEISRRTKQAMINVLDDLEEQKKTLQLAKMHLEEKQERLEKTNLELDSFVYTASHDLRAPLRGISSFATFLEEDYKDKLDKEGMSFLLEIRRGTERMSQLIDDLLTLSRISRIKNPYEDVNMKELIDSILERIEFDIKESNVELDIQDNFPVVRCDRIKIGEVFLNLINNAIKFSSKNEKENPKITVRSIEEEDRYRFEVSDNGIGIAPEHHDKIFDIFRRLHTQQEYDGTGAGLSIVKRVIDDHGGRVWVESELGKGATFIFTIPKNLKSKKRLGELLIEDGLITKDQLEQSLRKQDGDSERQKKS